MVEIPRYTWALTAEEHELRAQWREAARIADLELCERLVAQWRAEEEMEQAA